MDRGCFTFRTQGINTAPAENPSILELKREQIAQQLDCKARRYLAISGEEIGAPLPDWPAERQLPESRFAGAHGPPR